MGCCVSFLSRDNRSHATATTTMTTAPAPAPASDLGITTPTTTQEHCAGITTSATPEVQGSTTTIVPNPQPTTTLPSRSRTEPAAPISTIGRSATRHRATVTIANNLPLSEHFNEPIRPHVWYSKRRPWTRSQIDRERTEFFETRVTGRPEIWTALAAALSFLRDSDLDTAQSIIDAAGITVPTGDLCQGCYDEQGALYRLPQCIVSDPENMVETDDASGGDGDATDRNCFGDDNDLDDGEEEDEDDDLDEDLSDGKLAADNASGDELITDGLERRRDEKGKTSERDLTNVQVRLSTSGGMDLVLSVGKSRTVGFLARKIQQDANLGRSQYVRLAFLGKILQTHASLLEQGWQPGQVINAFIVTRASFIS